MDISTVIPVYNEEGNIKDLYSGITTVLKSLTSDYEIIFVDDGSSDKTFNILEKIHKQDNKVKVIKFRRNFGQTAALNIGFKTAKGKVIIQMDGDLQNDPKDIPRMLTKMKEGYDVVSGWRYKRKDPLSKKIFSKVASIMRKWLTKDKIHDSGCSLKLYKNECFRNLELYGEMHRFIPTLLRWKGFKISEVKVHHHPRKSGKTKYNIVRVFRGFLDLLNAKFWADYSTRPLHFFAKGALGMYFFAFAIIVYHFIRYGITFAVGPLLLAAVLFFLMGTMFFGFGFLGEFQSRLYYKANNEDIYNIEKILK